MTQSTLAAPAAQQPTLRLWPFVSVIVPVRNEARFIRSTLKRLLAQDYPCDRFEVIVVDGLSDDGTPGQVASMQREWSNLRLLHNPRRWSSSARNLGIQAARGEFVLVVDGHCEIEDDQYLRHVAEEFERSGADCLGRPQPLDVTDASPPQRAIALARSSRLGHHPDSHIYSDAEGFVPPQSVAVAYRRSIFAKIGAFDESFDACEDVELNHRVDRAGLRCFFTPKVRVKYHPRGTLTGLFHQLARYGRGRVRPFRKHPDSFSLKSTLPAWFLVGLAIGPLAGWFSSTLATAFAAVVACYVLVVLATSIGIAARQRDAGLLAWLPLVIPTIHLGAGWGVLQEWWLGRAATKAIVADATIVSTRVTAEAKVVAEPTIAVVSFARECETESTATKEAA